ncbi:MAG: hypothetical protein J2P53_03665 [Bradyrhizobiaceae bacterium]|nr:hypothetical protein [Bradyrhizobiaceae bacterium]
MAYNSALDQRISAYRRRRVSVSYNMQADELKAVRSEVPELSRWSFTAEQQVLMPGIVTISVRSGSTLA